MDERSRALACDPIGPLLLRLSLPATIGMLTHGLFNVVDTIFVGQGAGTDALAALAVAFPVQMSMLAVAMGLGIGGASMVSRALGARDLTRARRVTGVCFGSTIALGLAVQVLALIYLDPVCRAFGATGPVLPETRDYLGLILLTNVCFCFSVSSNNLVRAEGNARTAMWAMLVGALVNLALDPIFIFGLDMGIKGAGLATAIAQVCSFVYLVHYFARGSSSLRPALRDWAWDGRILWEMVAIGSSSLVRSIGAAICAVVVNHGIARYGNELHLAVFGAVNKTLVLCVMPLVGIVQGLQPIVGFNFGAHQLGRVRRAIGLATWVMTGVAGAFFLAYVCFPGPVLRAFNADPEFVSTGVPILRTINLVLPLVGVQMLGAAVFQALGQARPALLLTLLRQVILLIPLAWVLPLWFGLSGLWAAFPVADGLATLVTGLCLWLRLRSLARAEAELPVPPEAPGEPAAS